MRRGDGRRAPDTARRCALLQMHRQPLRRHALRERLQQLWRRPIARRRSAAAVVRHRRERFGRGRQRDASLGQPERVEVALVLFRTLARPLWVALAWAAVSLKPRRRQRRVVRSRDVRLARTRRGPLVGPRRFAHPAPRAPAVDRRARSASRANRQGSRASGPPSVLLSAPTRGTCCSNACSIGRAQNESEERQEAIVIDQGARNHRGARSAGRRPLRSDQQLAQARRRLFFSRRKTPPCSSPWRAPA